jgi:hypothetical protein
MTSKGLTAIAMSRIRGYVIAGLTRNLLFA